MAPIEAEPQRLAPKLPETWAYLAAQTLSAFMPISAAACVLYTVVPTSVVVAIVGFCSTMEHFFVVESCTTKYSFAARAGVTSAARARQIGRRASIVI
jgi:hypothetical protein